MNKFTCMSDSRPESTNFHGRLAVVVAIKIRMSMSFQLISAPPVSSVIIPKHRGTVCFILSGRCPSSLLKSDMDPATSREVNFSASRAAVTESTMDTTPLLPMLVVLG